MRPGAADVVLVLGDIGEMREEAEGTNDLQCLLWRQSVQCSFEIAPRHDILVAAKLHRAAANALDDVKDRLAALLAYRVAENAAEQTNILAQREVLVFALDRLWLRHGPLLRSPPGGCPTILAGTVPDFVLAGLRGYFKPRRWVGLFSAPAIRR